MTSSTPRAAPSGQQFIDLHMHSTASDGALPPADVVAAARAASLSAIALTDHDSVAGVEEAREAGMRLGVRVIAGVELSAFEEDTEFHVLGLHLSRLADLDRQLAAFRAARRTRAEKIVEQLNALGVPLSLEAVLAAAGEGAVGRPHIARALVNGGWVRDQRAAFDRFLGYGRPAFVAKYRLTMTEAIQLIHRAGGIAVLAHPGPDGTRARLESLTRLALDGVEVLHPGHSAEDVARIGALVEYLGLVPSGGSDWHGAHGGDRTIGCMHVPASWLEPQEARVRERLARERVA